jgi:hypothetical protein
MSTIFKKIITLSLAATILASCGPAATVVPDATMVFVSTVTRVPTTSPNPKIPAEQPVSPQLDEEIQLKIGETVTLDGGNLTIKFKSLAGDGRCPEGIECVWTGNAKVILEVSKLEIALNTSLDGDGGPMEQVVGNYNIQLREVLRYPKWGEEHKPESYSIKIVVSKK